MTLPVVAIVGRPNVGKSSLVNALARRRVSIVEPTPGVTRDRVVTPMAHAGRAFELMDTGGIGMEDGTPIAAGVQRQIEAAIAEADLILFVLDVRDGVTSLDEKVAARLRRAMGSPDAPKAGGGPPRGRGVLVVANKVDTSAFDPGAAEFFRLGFGTPLCVSALQRLGLQDLLDAIVARLPAHDGAPPRAPGLRIAIAGKRNVGKSTLVNTLACEERVIVSEIPGTTRDAVDVRIERGGKALVLVDTAGLRKKRKVEDAIELFSRMRTEAAIRRSDAVLFLLDIREAVSEVDLKIAGLIEASGKPCVIGLNKWDLANQAKGPATYLAYVRKSIPGLAYAPVAILSAKSGFKVWTLVDTAEELVRQSGTLVATGPLNRLAKAAEEWAHPRITRSRLPKIYYITQTGTHPPRFLLFVNNPQYFTADYRRFLAGKFRQELPCKEVPIKLELRGKRSERR
jgi:GTP-binding protein